MLDLEYKINKTDKSIQHYYDSLNNRNVMFPSYGSYFCFRNVDIYNNKQPISP